MNRDEDSDKVCPRGHVGQMSHRPDLEMDLCRECAREKARRRRRFMPY